MNLTWRPNYGKMGVSRSGIEWYTAQWWVVGLHVHNDTKDGRWTYRLSGYITRQSINHFDTKEEATKAVESLLADKCAAVVKEG
jgi:hypothetical protein